MLLFNTIFFANYFLLLYPIWVLFFITLFIMCIFNIFLYAKHYIIIIVYLDAIILIGILAFFFSANFYLNLFGFTYSLILFCIAAIETALGLLFLLTFSSIVVN